MRKYFFLIVATILLTSCAQQKVVFVSTLPPQNVTSAAPSNESAYYFQMGDAAYQLGDLATASSLLERAIAVDSTSMTLYSDYLEASWDLVRSKQKSLDDLILYGQKLIDKGWYNSDILSIMSTAYLASKNADKGILLLQEKMQLEATGIDYLRLFLLQSMYKKNPDIALLQKAEKLSGDNEFLMQGLADVYSQIDRPKAEQLLRQSYENFSSDLSLQSLLQFYLNSNNIDSLKAIPQSLVSKGHYPGDKQIELLADALYQAKAFSTLTDYWYLFLRYNNLDVIKRVFIAARETKVEKVMLQAYKQIIASSNATASDLDIANTSVAEYYIHSGQDYLIPGYLAKVKDSKLLIGISANYYVTGDKANLTRLENIYKLLPENGMSPNLYHFFLAQYYDLMDNPKQALSEINAVPADSIVSNDWIAESAGIYLHNADDIKTATSLLQRRKEQTPSIPLILAYFYYQSARKEQSLPYFEEELRTNAKPDSSTYLTAAQAYLSKADTTSAITVLRKGVIQYPQNDEILNFLGYTLISQNTNLAEADTLLSKAVKIKPLNTDYWDSLAWLYYLQGRYDEALGAMKTPIDQGIKYSVIAYHIGEIYSKLNNPKQAKVYFSKAIELNNDPETVQAAQNALKSTTKP